MTVPGDAADLAAQLPARHHERPGTVTGVDGALDLIAEGSRVYVAPFGAVPTTLLEAMLEQHDRWQRLETICDYLYEPLATFGRPAEPFVHTSLQASAALEPLRRLDRAGTMLRVAPLTSSQFARVMSPLGPYPVDVALVQVSEPGPDGRFSLGVVGGSAAEIVRSAPLVIAEVNPAMPYTRGVTECERADFDALVEVEHPLLEAPASPPSELATAIGHHVAGLVPERATLEYGIGAVPDAVLAALVDRADLGLHSGMLGDGMADLIDRGVVTGRAKTVDPGRHVTSVLVGSAQLYQWAAGRDDLVMVASSYSHGVPALARQERFTAINSAIEVSLDGAVNAEVAVGRAVSGPGGQPDFAVAAAFARDGVGIVALPSTAGRGRVSRIVERIDETRPVTVPRHLADRIVTEHGVAAVRGLDLEQRRQELLAIAHPDHRDAIAER